MNPSDDIKRLAAVSFAVAGLAVAFFAPTAAATPPTKPAPTPVRTVETIRKELDSAMKELEATDRMGNFEIQKPKPPKPS